MRLQPKTTPAERSSTRPRYRPPSPDITRSVYEKIKAAWEERPSLKFAQEAAPEVSSIAVRRVVFHGVPALNLPPVQPEKDFVAVNREMASLRRDEEAQAEAVRRDAQEAHAARVGIDVSLKAMQAVGALADRVLALIAEGKLGIEVETVTPKLVAALARMADFGSAALERSVKVARLHAGEPEQIIGVQIAALLETCTPDELEYVARHGMMPARVLGFAGRGATHVVEATAEPAGPDEPESGEPPAGDEPCTLDGGLGGNGGAGRAHGPDGRRRLVWTDEDDLPAPTGSRPDVSTGE